MQDIIQPSHDRLQFILPVFLFAIDRTVGFDPISIARPLRDQCMALYLSQINVRLHNIVILLK